MEIELTEVSSILTRTSGYLRRVVSHSLQPYRGCSFGQSLCGVGCYVQHSPWIMRGREWGTFLEVRTNADDVYRRQYSSERAWAHRRDGFFGIFMSSATDPFLPQEGRHRVSRRVLAAMAEQPPDRLILQTHTHRVLDHREAIKELAGKCELRVHISIETDRRAIKGLPRHASPIERRFDAARQLQRETGAMVVITVAPLLPIREPKIFFERVRECADAVIIDHFIEGDGSSNGSRTLRTPLPMVMEEIEPGSTALAYRDEMVAVARSVMPGCVGVGQMGFAGEFS
ncbi:hypothetical protein Pan216_57230 [Planctomycetes bacterium Pan216]|uniref:Radical SAM superfamily protein n=1 Tax=Kolteria novifilia TaxID=2527975 RepID=A0A518BCW8_9BACT|nr:hypothetical protein Pan216_57230 [Planctomycetes bacterium Pan216]